ncbi:MAG: hypothetical protein IPJ05_01000 [Nitrosomonas sp.]|nr:hypothetical protein [Nitrosomonas sp.]
MSFNNYALANHTDTTSPASCPDIEVNGGQSLTYWFKDYYTQKPYQGGQIVPIGTRLLHFIRAEAYGHCEMLQKEAPPGNGCFTFINVERKVNFIFSGLQFPNGSFGGFMGPLVKAGRNVVLLILGIYWNLASHLVIYQEIGGFFR